jgi:hypothetical protein
MRSPRRLTAAVGPGLWRGAVIVIAALAAFGCDGSSDQPTASPSEPVSAAGSTTDSVDESSPTPPAPTASPSERATDPVAEAVLDAYQGYWDAILAANDPPDENHPGLKRYATGAAYESVFNAAQTNRLAGRALRLPTNSVSGHRVEVVSIDGDTARVRDCTVNDGLVVDVDTGDVVNDEVVTRLATGRLRRVDGLRKVATTTVEQTWEGVAGCANRD